MPSATINEWSISIVTGGVPLELPYSQVSASIFSQDGRYLITTLSRQIRVYFVSTRQCIRTIDVDLRDLVDVKLDVTNPNQVILFKSFGEIVIVNYKDKLPNPVVTVTSIQQQLESQSVLSVVCVRHNKYIAVTGKKEKKKNQSWHTRHLISIDRTADSVSTIGEIHNVLQYAVSLDTTKIAFAICDQTILLLDLATYYSNCSSDESPESTSPSPTWGGKKVEELIVKEVIPYQYRSPITSIAVSNDSVIALGTNSGVIQILYGDLMRTNNNNNTEKRQQRLFKWHLDQVNALQFSSDNNYLLSGGIEKVLIFWQLETEKKQFLPRLNGTIEKLSIDIYKNDYITLLLKTDVANFEVLVLSLVDLVSRLSVNTIRPKFANNLKTTLSRTKKKLKKDVNYQNDFNKLKLKYDYTCAFEIHTKTKNLYFPNESSIQAFDIVRNEQNFVQNVASVISTGKVRGESKISDPQISLLKFSNDGEWMCTYDEVTSSEVDSLISTKDKQYALKFWKFNENKEKDKDKDKDKDSRNGVWELTTKIIDPHGKGTAVLSLIPAPSSYFNGVAFLTADNKGSVRVWRPTFPKEAYKVITSTTNFTQNQNKNKSQQIAWTLRKQKPATSNTTFDAVSLAWSDDGSIIFLGHEYSITCIDVKTFEPIPDFNIPILTESKIRSIHFLSNYLVVLSKTRFFVYDLISARLTDLVTKVHSTSGGRNLITIDSRRNLIALAINYYTNYDGQNVEDLTVASKLYIFKPNQLKPVFVKEHTSGIAALRCDSKSFLFIDLECRVGAISSTLLEDIEGTAETQDSGVGSLSEEIKQMLITAQGNVDLMNHRVDVQAQQQQQNGSGQDRDEFESAMSTSEKVVDLHTFQSVFQNLDGLQIETIFDRITDILK
ncbi:NAN1 [Candida oxycetoniae]|uniref:NAN1 n=1 Tax=Candida oxycetoniae TaxID=497107 RepID=A0AAI9SUL2_9ASCO|nr:NAN1 [Candida oxycetoniae]KAI3403180.2 NAN1 [Candida oxycetoniae]